jgi:hypothetical protein
MKIGQISFFEMTTPADRPYGSRGSARSTAVSAVRPRAVTRKTSTSNVTYPNRKWRDGASSDHHWPRRRHPASPLPVDVSTGCRASSARGQPAPRRWQGFRKVSEAEVVEVAGQRKLLKWTVPGLAHFFTMWGFTVLMTTIIEAYGSLFRSQLSHSLDRSRQLARLHRGLLRHGRVGVARASSPSSASRTRRRARTAPAASTAVTLGAAWLVLFMIALVIVTLLIYRGAQINTGHFPFTHIKPGYYAFSGSRRSSRATPRRGPSPQDRGELAGTRSATA